MFQVIDVTYPDDEFLVAEFYTLRAAELFCADENLRPPNFVIVEDDYHPEYRDYYRNTSPVYRDDYWGKYRDEDPIEDYWQEKQEDKYWSEVFATPESMVKHYAPPSPSISVADKRNFWYTGVLKDLETTMPYISPEARDEFAPILEAIQKTEIGTPGNLNFLITNLCKKFLSEQRESYDRHNSIVGVLDSAKMEWYRRRVAPYEDKKIAENGDV